MPTIALLGAGFSRNWGGWLASEAFEYLIGTPEVRADPGLRELLWRYLPTGGFEDALAHLQESLRHPPANDAGIEYMDSNVPLRSQAGALQAAVSRMFDEMNVAYNSLVEFHPRIVEFLSHFDALFTLNQDMLLERLYTRVIGQNVNSGGRWRGAILPGMRKTRKIRHSNGVEFWSEYDWEPVSASERPASEEDSGLQPIYKLHGSSQWYVTKGVSPILIIGGDKAQTLRQFDILRWYWERFSAWLSRGVRLLVIGYSFRDPHINDALVLAAEHGLELFVVDPNGPAAGQGSPQIQALFRKALMGASRRPLLETLLNDRAEASKVSRFLAGP
jgi:hypothetical protein